MPSKTLLIVFAKAPEPCKVKTRLMQAISAEQAAAVYTRLLNHTLGMAKQAPCDVAVWRAGDAQHSFWQQWPGFDYYPQIAGGLGDKMAAAIQQGLKTYSQVLIIGSDCYVMDKAYISKAVEALAQHDVVIGPADDGGYVLLGLKQMHTELFNNIDWSTNKVLPQTLAAAKLVGLRTFLLPVLSDIDTPEDALKAGLLS